MWWRPFWLCCFSLRGACGHLRLVASWLQIQTINSSQFRQMFRKEWLRSLVAWWTVFWHPCTTPCHGAWWLPCGGPGDCGVLILQIFETLELCLQETHSLRLWLDRCHGGLWESNVTGECFLIMSTLPAPICPLARAPRSYPSPSSFSPAPHAPTTPPSPLLAGPPVGGPGPAPVPGLRQGFKSGPESGFRFGLGLARINEISKPKIPRHSY